MDGEGFIVCNYHATFSTSYYFVCIETKTPNVAYPSGFFSFVLSAMSFGGIFN